MNALDRILEAYDEIRSTHIRNDDPPPWKPRETPTPAPESAHPRDLRPVPEEPITPPKTNWNNIRADKEERAQRLLDRRYQERLGESRGRQNMMNALEHPNRGTFIQDEHGINQAYGAATGTFYDGDTRTLNIRGSVTKQDWKDDFLRIPAWGDSRGIEMYKNAKLSYDKLISEGKPVDRVVGHSLGGSVALQLQKDKDIPFSRTFGAPVLDVNPFQKNVERYRHVLDPFSILDRGAHNVLTTNPYTHSYTGYSKLSTR